MALIHWRNAVSGDFSNAADWSGGPGPGAADEAILDAPGSTAYTVSVRANATVDSIQTAPTALLDILADFSATNGTGTGVNAGAIRVENGGVLTLQGTVNNTGSIEIFGTVSTTSIVLGAGGVTLTGSGAIFMNFTGGKYQQIVAAPGGSVLTDVSERISGQGLIGGAGLTIINEALGFLEAKGGLLTIDTGANTIINAGLIDAEGEPDCYPQAPAQGVVQSPVDNSGFLKADGDGSSMTFNGAVTGSGRGIIAGGILRFNAGFNQSVGFTRSTGVLALAQSVNYTALITGFSASGGEFLDLGDIGFVGAGEATYAGTTGSGYLTVSDGTHTARIHFEGDYTATVFTCASDGHGGTLVTDGPKAIHWQSPVNGAFSTAADWAGGVPPGPLNDVVLDAAGAAYTVTQTGAATVTGVQLASNAALSVIGVFAATGGTDGGIEAGHVTVANGGTLAAGGAWDLTGVTQLSATTGQALVIVNGVLALEGGGEVLMTGSSSNVIIGSTAGATLTNVDCKIVGGGYLGAGQMVLINQAAGVIWSADPTHPLLINTGANTIINAGVIRAGGAGLTIESPLDNTGHLQALGATLTVTQAVTGAGNVFISAGTARFDGGFSQSVVFGAAGGVLSLAQSTHFTGFVQGYAASGRDVLDLGDIHFTSAGEASFSGTAGKGVLTVSDGVHTVHINLQGTINGVGFVASDDGHGGTMVTDMPTAASIQGFVAAMASQNDGSGGMTAPILGTPAIASLVAVASHGDHGHGAWSTPRMAVA